jgi:hypothetical protein
MCVDLRSQMLFVFNPELVIRSQAPMLVLMAMMRLISVHFLKTSLRLRRKALDWKRVTEQ